MKRRRSLGRRLLRMADPAARSHQVELAGLDRCDAAEAVSVLDRSVDQPRHGLQADVRVWRDPHARHRDHGVRPEVVDEAPGADHAPVTVRQRPVDHAGLRDRHVPPGQDLVNGEALRLTAAHRLNRRGLEVAHGLTLRRRLIAGFQCWLLIAGEGSLTSCAGRSLRWRREYSRHTAASVRVGVGGRATTTALGHAVDADGDLLVAVSQRQVSVLAMFVTAQPGELVPAPRSRPIVAPVASLTASVERSRSTAPSSH